MKELSVKSIYYAPFLRAIEAGRSSMEQLIP